MGGLLALEDCGGLARARVGGKAWGLGRLLALGLPVPLGRCVPTDAFCAHVRRERIAGVMAAALDAGRPLEDRAGALDAPRDAIEAAPLDPAMNAAIADATTTLLHVADGTHAALAVRSSATAEDLEDHSFAGPHDSVLDVADAARCAAAVARCWASLFSDRAVAYRERHGVAHDGVAMAVVIQRQVPVDVGGVLFSVDPVGGRDDRVVIEACAGSGEALVSGRVTPDRVVLSRPELTVVSREPAVSGGTPVLADGPARELGRLALALEPAWAGAVDVEWAIASGAIAVLQARRVTAVASPSPAAASAAGLAPPEERPEDAWEARQVWTNVNAGEVAPDVMTPMTWCVIEPVATRLLGVFFELAGVEAAGHPLLGRVGGRVYFNLNTLLGLLRRLPGMKGKGVLQLFGGEEEAPPELGDLDIPEEDIPEARYSALGMLARLPGLAWSLLRFRGAVRRGWSSG